MHVSPSNKRYIGITSIEPERRWRNGNGYRKQRYFYNAIKKYEWKNFQHIIIAKGLSEDEAKWLEIELIKMWDTTNHDKGYNITLGGEGANGLKLSEETRQKMSESRKGKLAGEKNPNYGRCGELNYFYGKHHTEETKKKMGKPIICLTTKKIFFIAKEGAEFYNTSLGNIIGCCKEHIDKQNYKNKSAGKLPDGTPLVWRYYEDYLNMSEEEIQQAIEAAKANSSSAKANSSSAKAVICITTKNIFYAIRKAAKYYNCDRSSIIKCLKGRQKSAGKLDNSTPLKWMYLDDFLSKCKYIEL